MEKKTKRDMEKDTQLMRAVVSDVQSINRVITHCGKDRSAKVTGSKVGLQIICIFVYK